MSFMDIFSLLRDGIEPATAARAGYLQGEQQREQRDYERGLQQQALARQSTLDQLKARLDESTIHRNSALERRYDALSQDGNVPVQWMQDEQGNYVPMPRKLPGISPSLQGGAATPPAGGTTQQTATPPQTPQSGTPTPATGTPRMTLGQPSGVKAPKKNPAPGPKTIIDNTREYRPWDAVTGTFGHSGIHAPTPQGRGGAGSATSADRLELQQAKTALDEGLKGIPRPSKIPAQITNPDILNAKPGTDIKKLPVRIQNPQHNAAVADSLAYEQNTLGPLRKRLYDVTSKGAGLDIDGGAGGGAAARAANRMTNTVVPADDPGGAGAPPSGTPNANGDVPPKGNFDLGPAVPVTKSAPKVSAESMKQAQSEFTDAGERLKVMLSSPSLTDQDKTRARTLYDERMKSIAQKYGLSTGAK